MTFDETLLRSLEKRQAHGCSTEEISALERRLNVQLPSSYKKFLEIGGRGIEGFCVGSDYECDQLDDLQQCARELLEENNESPLPPGSFAFLMHQGYEFQFLHQGRVYYYSEGERGFKLDFNSFEEFFDSAISSELNRIDLPGVDGT